MNREPGGVLAALARAWERYPNQRVGQLIVNALRETFHYPDPFYVENDELASLLDQL